MNNAEKTTTPVSETPETQAVEATSLPVNVEEEMDLSIEMDFDNIETSFSFGEARGGAS